MRRANWFQRIAVSIGLSFTVSAGLDLAQCPPDPNALAGAVCGPGAPVPQAIGACPFGTLVFTDQVTLSWVPACVGTSDVARGDLECLRSGIMLAVTCDSPAGQPPPPAAACGIAGALATDLNVPLLDEGYWYLVRTTGFTWDSPAPQLQDYDPGLGDITGCP